MSKLDETHEERIPVYLPKWRTTWGTKKLTDSLATLGMEYPLVFRADHPFLYLIRETNTGAVLFMGRFVNPAT